MVLVVTEMILYCLIVREFESRVEEGSPSRFPIRDSVKKLDKNINELLGRVNSRHYMYGRFINILNIIVQIRFELADEPPKEYIRAIHQASKDFSNKSVCEIHSIMPAYLFQQFSRCKLMQGRRAGGNPSVFFYTITQASALFWKKKNHLNAKAGYIIAEKILRMKGHESWGHIQESIYYYLAVIELEDIGTNDFMKKKLALGHFIKAINNHHKGKNSELKIPMMSEKKIYDLILNSKPQEIEEIVKIVEINLRNLEFNGYVLMTDEEITRTLNKNEGIGNGDFQTSLLSSNLSLSSFTSSYQGSLNKQTSRGTSSKDVSSQFEKANKIKEGLDKILNILSVKLPDNEYKMIKDKITYTMMSSSAYNLSKNIKELKSANEITYYQKFMRNVSVGDSVQYKISVKNNYFVA